MLLPTLLLTILTLISHGQCYSMLADVVPAKSLIHHERRGIDQSVLLENGKAAQKLNSKFSSMTSDSPCKTGDMACIAGAFSQCVGGKFVGGPCAQGLKCFAMPLLLKKGTTLGCDTEADATSRISNTGATGGLTGAGDSDSRGSSTVNGTASESPTGGQSTNGTQPDTTGMDQGASAQAMGANPDGNTNANSSTSDVSAASSNSTEGSDLTNNNKTLKKDSDQGLPKDSGANNGTQSETDIDLLNPPPKGFNSTSSGDQINQSPAKGKDDKDENNINSESSNANSGGKNCQGDDS